MNSKPIPLKGHEVRAILDDRQTQIRRVVKPQPEPNRQHDGGTVWVPKDGLYIPCGTVGHLSLRHKQGICCPYGKPGDQLWVRETFVQGWRINPITDTLMLFDGDGNELPLKTWYRATDGQIGWSDDDGWQTNVPWKPSIHMPRAASRITLEVTGVRVEKLKDITEDDCRAEGAKGGNGSIPGYRYSATPREHYRHIWESIHGKDSFDANPWVWVVSFERMKP